MTTAYEEARARLKEALRASDDITMPEVFCTRETARALLAGPPEPSEEEVARIVDAFATAENGLSYSIHLVKLVDGVETRRLKVQGEAFEYTDDASNDFDANQACYDHLNRVRKQLRIEAVQALYRKP